MPKLPTAQDVKKARQQATEAVSEAIEQARTPLYAVLGAGDLASEAVRDYLTKARTDATGQAKDVQARLNELQARLTDLQDRLVEVRSQVRTRVTELPDEVAGLRGKLDADQLRHALENYAQSLQSVYERLAARGESTVDNLRQKPQVKTVIDRVEDVADSTEVRVGKFVEDARELAYDVLGRISRRTRSTGEKAAHRTQEVADDVAEAVETAGDSVADAIKEAGDETASTTRSVTRKAANRTQPAKSTTTGGTGTTATTRKNTTARKASTKA